jgi:hypothetical protein
MAQQTAVEWFMEKIGEKQTNGMYLIDTLEDVQNVFEQAKAMEKEQIISAWLSGENDGSLEPKAFVEMAEQYYNETFEL